MKHIKNVVTMALLLFLSTLIVPTASSFVAQTPIIGVVYAEGNVPVRGATVTVTGSNSSAVGTTDANGNFQITSGLGTGTCSVTASAFGYLDAMVSISVTAGSPVTVPGILLKKSGAISGSVGSASTGPPPPPPTCERLGTRLYGAVTPIAGAVVTAVKTSAGGNASSFAVTGSDGSYIIAQGLSTGTYNVQVVSAGNVVDKQSVNVVAGEEQVNIDFNMASSGWVVGKVTSSSGLPLFHAVVTATSSDGKYSATESTDSSGDYKIVNGLVNGTYTVTATYGSTTSSKSVTVVQGKSNPSPTNFQLTVSPIVPGILIGRVTDRSSGKVISSATVKAMAGQTVAAQATTDTSGYYSILVAAGSYTVAASAAGCLTNTTTTAQVVATNQTVRVYYPTAASPGFLLSKVSGSNSATMTGNVTGERNPIPEFPIVAVPVIFSLAILLILLASRKIKRNKI